MPICPYCKTQEYKIQYPTYDIFDNNYEIVCCKQCKAYFLTPNPTDKQLAIAYDDSYYGGSEADEKFEGFVEKGLSFFRKQRAKHVFGLLSKKTSSKAKILDIGCGNGQFLDSIQSIGNIDIYGTEMPGSSAKRASKIENIKLKIGVLESNNYPDNFFELITMFHVFEHLTEPERYLDIIDEILKKDGYLIVSFPNIDSWQAKFFKGKWLHLDPPRHLFFYKPKDFIDIMKGRGFELQKEQYFSIEQNPYGAIQSYFNLFHSKRELLFEYLKENYEYTKGTSKLLLKLEKLLFLSFTPLFVLIDLIAALFKKSATVEFVFRKK